MFQQAYFATASNAELTLFCDRTRQKLDPVTDKCSDLSQLVQLYLKNDVEEELKRLMEYSTSDGFIQVMYDSFIQSGWDLSQFEASSAPTSQDLLLQAQTQAIVESERVGLTNAQEREQILQQRSYPQIQSQSLQVPMPEQPSLENLSLELPNQQPQTALQLSNRQDKQQALPLNRDEAYSQLPQPASRMQRPKSALQLAAPPSDQLAIQAKQKELATLELIQKQQQLIEELESER